MASPVRGQLGEAFRVFLRGCGQMQRPLLTTATAFHDAPPFPTSLSLLPHSPFWDGLPNKLPVPKLGLTEDKIENGAVGIQLCMLYY